MMRVGMKRVMQCAADKGPSGEKADSQQQSNQDNRAGDFEFHLLLPRNNNH